MTDRAFETTERQTWFRFFEDAELAGLVEQALAGNPGLESARARLRQAGAREDLSESAFWPRLSGSIEAQRSKAPLPLPGAGTDATTREEYSASLAAQYEVDVWGRLRSEQRAAELSREAAESALRAAAMTIAAQVSDTWLGLIASRQRVETLERQLRTSLNLLELTERRLANGQGSALSVSRQEQQSRGVEELLQRERTRAQTLVSRLAVLLGRAPQGVQEPLSRADAFPPLPAVPEPGIPVDLLYRRPDLQSALRGLEAEEARAAAVLAERFPALRLQGSLFGQASSPSETLEELFWRIAASLSEELFDGGAESARIDLQRAVASERFADFREALVEALGEVDTTGTQYDEQMRVLALLEEQREAARASVELAELQFARGELSYIQVLDTLRVSQQTELAELEARRRLYALHVQLCRALGGVWSDKDTQRITGVKEERER